MRSLPRQTCSAIEMSDAFRWPIRVYYEDTDAGGVVYHSKYLNYMERARTEWLRALGFEQDELVRDWNVLFVVRQMELDFHSPARFNERLVVETRVLETGKASLIFAQEIRRDQDARALCAARVKIACLAADRFRPRALPEALTRKLPR